MFIKGIDVSTLLEVESLGGQFFDTEKEDKDIQGGDALDILKKYGCNWLRLRLWNNPYSEDGKPYGAGTNDFDKLCELMRRGRDKEYKILLDYHYSDFWADPGKQYVPKAWRGFNVEELKKAVYDYTYETLSRLRSMKLLPQMVQVGNELSNGLLWPLGKVPEYDNIASFVSAGIKAVRRVSKEALSEGEIDEEIKVMIHLDNGGNNELYRRWFDNYIKRGEDFDIIGLSYYPFWHGSLKMLEDNMKDIVQRYQKDLVIAEVSMGYTMEDYASYEKLSPEERKGYATRRELVEKIEYPMTREGQANFMLDFLTRISRVGYADSHMESGEDAGGGVCEGFFYWEPAWIPVPGSGWATPESLEYIKESGPCGNEWANQALFDYDGYVLPALKTIRDF